MPRTASVTGGNRGIGLETCRQLVGAGCSVALTACLVDEANKAARLFNTRDSR